MLVFIFRALVLLGALSPALLAGAAEAADAPFAGVIDVAAGGDATIDGSVPGVRAGSSVAFAGDFNGDGRQDYAVSMSGAKEVDVVFAAPFPELAPITLPAARGVAIRGRTITSVAGA